MNDIVTYTYTEIPSLGGLYKYILSFITRKPLETVIVLHREDIEIIQQLFDYRTLH